MKSSDVFLMAIPFKIMGGLGTGGGLKKWSGVWKFPQNGSGGL